MNRDWDQAIWEFLFCRGPLRAPLLNRSLHGSQRDVAYVLPIHGQNDSELAGGTPGHNFGGTFLTHFLMLVTAFWRILSLFDVFCCTVWWFFTFLFTLLSQCLTFVDGVLALFHAPLEKNQWKNEKVLEMGREKKHRALTIAFWSIFLRQIDWW